MCIIEADKFSKTVKVNVKMHTIIEKLKMRICKNKYNINQINLQKIQKTDIT